MNLGYDIVHRPIGARLGVLVHGAFDEDNTNVSKNFLFIRLQLLHLKYDEPNGDFNSSTTASSNSITYSENDQVEYSIPIVDDIDQIDFVHETTKLLVLDVKETMLNQIDDGRTKLRLRIRTNLPISIPIRLAYNTTPIDKSVGVIYAAVILVGLYAMIIWEIVHRTFAAIIASTTSIGILALMNERPTMPELMSWIDVETLLLLFGMMILVAILSETGVFDYLAVYAYKVCQQVANIQCNITNHKFLSISGHQRSDMATDQLSVPFHSHFVVVPWQCNDSFIDDTRHHTFVRSDAIESGADLDVDGDFLKYRRHIDASRRSAQRYHRFE